MTGRFDYLRPGGDNPPNQPADPTQPTEGGGRFDYLRGGGSDQPSYDLPTRQQNNNNDTPGAFGNNQFDWNAAGQRINAKVWNKNPDGSYTESDPNILMKAARVTGETVSGALGFMDYLRESGQKLLSIPQTLEDIANQSQSFLPEISKEDWVRKVVMAQPAFSTIGAIYNTARIVTGNRHLSWEQMQNISKINEEYSAGLSGTELAQKLLKPLENTSFQIYKETPTTVGELIKNSSAGRNLFTDVNLREEYVRRAMSGENPQKIIAELSNPFAEMTFDMVVDPTNLIGGVVDDAMKAAKLAKASRGFEAVAEVKDGWQAIRGAKSIDEVAPVIDKMAETLLARNVKADAGLIEKGLDYLKPWRADSVNKASTMADTADQVFKSIAVAMKSQPDNFAETVRAMTLLGSNKPENIKEALQVLRGMGSGIGDMATSKEGLDTAQLLSKMFIDETGNITGVFFDGVAKAAKAGDLPLVLEKWDKLYNRTLKEMYPSVLEMAKTDAELVKNGLAKKYNVPGWAVAVAKSHEGLQKTIIGKTNEFFSLIYLTSPGYTARNFENNVFTAVVDFGLPAAKDTVGSLTKSGSDRMLGKIEEILGFVNRPALRGFSGPVEAKGNWWLLNKIKNINSKVEQAGSIGVVYQSVKRTFGKALKEGVAIAPADELRNLGLANEQVERLIGLTRTHNGDARKAIELWLGEVNSGVIDTFRDTRVMLNPTDIHLAENTPGLMEGVQEVLAAPEKQDALKLLDKIRAEWDGKAAKAVDGMLPGIDDGTDIGQGVRQAINEGLSESNASLFNVKLRVQRSAQNTMNSAGKKTLWNVGTEVTDPAVRESVRILADETEQRLAAIGAQVTKEHDGLRNQVWGMMNNPNLTDPRKLENVAVRTLPGFEEYLARPMVTHNGIKDAIWQFYFEQRNTMEAGKLGQYEKLWTDMFQPGGSLSALVGNRNLTQEAAWKLAQSEIADARMVMAATHVNEKGIWIDAVKYALDNGKTKDAVIALGAQYGIASASKAGVPTDQLLNTINKFLPDGTAAYTSLDEIPFDVAQKAIQEHALANGAKVIDGGLSRVGVPVMDGMMPTAGQAAKANHPGVKAFLDRLEAGIESKWGRGSAVDSITPEQMAAVNRWEAETTGRSAQLRAIASRVSQQERDFALLDYGKKTSLDHALAYIMPYQFWYNRSYQNWMGRLAQHPEVLSHYAAYKKYLEQEHAGLPDWWKYNVSVNDLPGVNVENPMYINLEATLNPLNGIMGIDFNDSNKLVGAPGTFEYYSTRILDGVNKFGPSTWTPISLAMAGWLAYKGEQDAAQRWAGRLIPITAPVKAVASLFGKNLELDPAIWLSSGKGLNGYDAYEARRIGRAMGAMIDDGTITAEQGLIAMQKQEGDIFNAALTRATKERAIGGTISGYMFGTGFKSRSQSDMSIDQFYEDYNALWQQKQSISPAEFKVAMDVIRERYPFMDAVLLSKKGGWERDSSYAYNVLGRIAPGDVTAITKAAGLPANIVDKFYSEKGDISKWSDADQKTFMGGVLRIGTTLAIPKYSTQQEWTKARNEYNAVSTLVETQLGKGIWDKVSRYYDLKDDNEKKAYLRDNPDVQAAMDYRTYAITQSPLLSAYYNGLKNIDGYYEGEFKREVMKKLGADYFDMLHARDKILDKKTLAAFDAKFKYSSRLKEYNKMKKVWDDLVQRKMIEFGKELPEGKPSESQPGPYDTGQQQIIDAITPAPEVRWQDIQGTIPQNLQIAIGQYFTSGRPFTTSEKYFLKRTADVLGIKENDILNAASKMIP